MLQLSDATLAASSKVLLSSARGREILMEKLSKQIPVNQVSQSCSVIDGHSIHCLASRVIVEQLFGHQSAADECAALPHLGSRNTL